MYNRLDSSSSSSSHCRWLFETGRLGPEHDYFHCVVNIPEDVVKVGDDDDEHRTVLTSSSSAAAVPTYGGTSSTMIGTDERNGRVNPALEVNDDEIDLTEMKRRKAKRVAAAGQQNVRPSNTAATQGQTAL